MKVVHIIVGLGMGGAERVVLDLSTQCRTITAGVIALSENKEMLPQYKNNNIPVLFLSMSKNLTSIIKGVVDVIRYVDDRSINIIHAHMFHSLLIACIVKILRNRVKIVFTLHSIKICSKFREIFVWSTRSFRENDILFSKQQESKIYTKSVLIPNGIDLLKYTPTNKFSSDNVFRIIAVGRLDLPKNHLALVAIIKKVFLQGYQCELEIVGEGPLRNKIEQAISKEKMKENIRLLGLQYDVPSLLSRSNCFIMPSLWEGLPIALLEAAASKVPIISTPVGSIPALLNTQNAYVGQVEQFPEMIIDVMTDYAQALKKTEFLYKEMKENYSLESMCNAHKKLYLEVAAA